MLLCEPNISEGRDPDRISRLVESVRASSGVELLHASADPDHHRLVLAYRGEPDAVMRATVALAEVAFSEIDLRTHVGVHPRVGALDVVPFVRSSNTSEACALEACREFGREIGARGVPVFFYERSATSVERSALPAVRAGQFEGLQEKMKDPAWKPDEGPPTPHPSAGAVITGVREPLVRFNVNLASSDPSTARNIAAIIRASSGGLPHVRALGIPLERRGQSQVTINLTRYRETPLALVVDRVLEEAQRAGVAVVGTEAIGLIPRDALDGIDAEALNLEMVEDQIVDIEFDRAAAADR